MSNRNLKLLTQRFEKKVKLFILETAGEIFVTDAKRTAKEQKELYKQGRTKPGKIVTWTLSSNHMGGEAVDIGFRGKLYPKDLNRWKRIAKIANRYGIDWGYDLWGKDKPHFQDNGKDIFAPNEYRGVKVTYSNDFAKKPGVVASYLQRFKVIVVASDFFKVSLTRQKAVLLHEYSHHVYYTMPNKFRVLWVLVSNFDTKLLTRLKKYGLSYKENSYFTEYAKTSPVEDFAVNIEMDSIGKVPEGRYAKLKLKIAKYMFNKFKDIK